MLFYYQLLVTVNENLTTICNFLSNILYTLSIFYFLCFRQKHISFTVLDVRKLRNRTHRAVTNSLKMQPLTGENYSRWFIPQQEITYIFLDTAHSLEIIKHLVHRCTLLSFVCFSKPIRVVRHMHLYICAPESWQKNRASSRFFRLDSRRSIIPPNLLEGCERGVRARERRRQDAVCFRLPRRDVSKGEVDVNVRESVATSFP